MDSPLLSAAAESDVFWDRIVAIEHEAEEEVFDLTVPTFQKQYPKFMNYAGDRFAA